MTHPHVSVRNPRSRTRLMTADLRFSYWNKRAKSVPRTRGLARGARAIQARTIRTKISAIDGLYIGTGDGHSVSPWRQKAPYWIVFNQLDDTPIARRAD